LLDVKFYISVAYFFLFLLFWNSSSFTIQEIIFIYKWKFISFICECCLSALTYSFKKFVESGTENREFFTLRMVINFVILIFSVSSYISPLWCKKLSEWTLLEIRFGWLFVRIFGNLLTLLYGYVVLVIQKKHGVMKCLVIISNK
jgi:hypothetical protein